MSARPGTGGCSVLRFDVQRGRTAFRFCGCECDPEACHHSRTAFELRQVSEVAVASAVFQHFGVLP